MTGTQRSAAQPGVLEAGATGPAVVPWVFGAAAVGCQIGFPFTDGGTFWLTIASVLLLALASVSHALVERGPAAALALVAVAGGGGLLAETVGVHTGWPFGRYEYAGTLGVQLAGVPALVPAAWVMMAYPALLVGRRLSRGRTRWATAVVGAWALASWDVFLDPQMVDAGHWRWAHPSPGLPGVDGVPLSNYAGWLLVAALMIALLDRFVADPVGRRRDDRLPAALYLWTYASSVLANAVFFGRPPVAVVGALAMGVVAVPYAVSLWRARTAR